MLLLLLLLLLFLLLLLGRKRTLLQIFSGLGRRRTKERERERERQFNQECKNGTFLCSRTRDLSTTFFPLTRLPRPAYVVQFFLSLVYYQFLLCPSLCPIFFLFWFYPFLPCVLSFSIFGSIISLLVLLALSFQFLVSIMSHYVPYRLLF